MIHNDDVIIIGHPTNNFIMAQVQDVLELGDGPLFPQEGALIKRSDSRIHDNYQSQFMEPLEKQKSRGSGGGSGGALSKEQAEGALRDIYSYYERIYVQQRKQLKGFGSLGKSKLNIQHFLLFCKDFHLLKTMFTRERLTILFKKHADYGKYLSPENFIFLLTCIAHQKEASQYLNLHALADNQEAAEEQQKQAFYKYLQLAEPDSYKKNYRQIWRAFGCENDPEANRIDYNYRKFSLPELRQKALPEARQPKKNEKDLFIYKHEKPQANLFDEAKSIVVSWDSLRAKTVTNVGKPSDLVSKRYIRADPEEDPYLKEVRPASRSKAENEAGRHLSRATQIQKKIKQIEQQEQAKNQKILKRIEKKMEVSSARRIKM